MITLNDDYQFERDNYCWHLHTWSDGLDKEKNPKRQKKTTYHANLKQVANAIIEREAGKCDSMESLKGFLYDASDRLTAKLDRLAG